MADYSILATNKLQPLAPATSFTSSAPAPSFTSSAPAPGTFTAPAPTGGFTSSAPSTPLAETPDETNARRAAENDWNAWAQPKDGSNVSASNAEGQIGIDVRNYVFNRLTAAPITSTKAGLPTLVIDQTANRIAADATAMYSNLVRNGASPTNARSQVMMSVKGQVDSIILSYQTEGTHLPGDVNPQAGRGQFPGGTGQPPPDNGGININTPGGVQSAQQVYQDAVSKGTALYGDLSKGPIQPTPTSLIRPIQYENLTPSQVNQYQAPIDVTRQDVVGVTGADTAGIREAGSTKIDTRQLIPEQMEAARRLEAARQAGVTAQGADTTRLTDVAEGRGAVNDQAEALLRLQSMRAAQQRQGLINQARGGERRGLRRQELANAGQLDLELADKIVAQRADRQLQATTKLADLDQQTKQLQAQLDQAKAQNDQAAINDINKKMADLDQERARVNAELRQDAAKFSETQRVDVAKFSATQRLAAETSIANLDQQIRIQQSNLDQARARGDADAMNLAAQKIADLNFQREQTNAQLAQDAGKFNTTTGVEVQKSEQDLGLRAQDQEEKQRVEDARLRIEAQKALEASAQGLLNEDQRQQSLKMAYQQLDLAERRFQAEVDQQRKANADADRRFWTTFITTLVAQGVGVAMGKPPTAAHGGAVTGRRLVEVGEAGDDELIVPVAGKLSPEMAAKLSIEARPFTAAGPKRTIDSKEDLIAAMEATLRTLRDDRARDTPDDEEMMEAMAGGIVRGRKEKQVSY